MVQSAATMLGPNHQITGAYQKDNNGIYVPVTVANFHDLDDFGIKEFAQPYFCIPFISSLSAEIGLDNWNQNFWIPDFVLETSTKVNADNSYNSGDGNKAIKISDKQLEQIHITRGRKILEAAAKDKNEVLILGAFGCGAFMNKPEVVAGAYKQLIGEFQNAFEIIEFAVYCSPRDDSNFRIFEQILKMQISIIRGR